MIPETIDFDRKKCWRIIPSCYPPINLFERVAAPEDLESVFEIESLTNDRLRDEVGDLSLVPKEDRISGPNTSFIMAAFTHLNPEGSRFSDGTFGVYYGAFDLETALSETKFHREKFLRSTNENPIRLDMRVLTATITGRLQDATLPKYEGAKMYDLESYSASQEIARKLREKGANGIHYHSVRNKGGKNIALFKPRLLSRCTQEQHLEYIWDGQEISAIYEKTLLPRPLGAAKNAASRR